MSERTFVKLQRVGLGIGPRPQQAIRSCLTSGLKAPKASRVTLAHDQRFELRKQLAWWLKALCQSDGKEMPVREGFHQ